jgi:vacuolar-type H+-ATPase subunit D/Vma8
MLREIAPTAVAVAAPAVMAGVEQVASVEIPIFSVATFFAVLVYGIRIGRWIGTVDSRLGGVETKVASVATEVANLETKVVNLETTVTDIKRRMLDAGRTLS